MIKKFLILLAVTFLFNFMPDLLKAEQNQDLLEQIKSLQNKLQELEKKVEQQSSTIQETKDAQKDVKEASDMLKTLKEHIAISGALEVETNYSKFSKKDEKSEHSSDITLATAEIDIEATLNEYASGKLVFLWEEDDTEPVDIDEGYLTLGGSDTVPIYLKAGKMYVPFGNFESNFISDPLTLEIGETRESAVQFGVSYRGIDLSTYFFNPDIDENRDSNADIIKSWGATLSVEFGNSSEKESGSEAKPEYANKVLNVLPEETSLNIQISYINNISDGDSFKDAMSDNDWGSSVKDYVGGFHAFLMAEFFSFNFIAEYLSAVDDFDQTDFGEIGKKFQPETWNFELGYTFPFVYERELTVALKYGGSNEAAFIDPIVFMEEEYGIVFSTNLLSNEKWGTELGLSLEYLHGEADEDIVKLLGESIDSRDSITLQLSATF